MIKFYTTQLQLLIILLLLLLGINGYFRYFQSISGNTTPN
jgi:hypothetical protein